MRLCVFIGDDSTMPEVAQVCAFSLRRHSSIDFDIRFLNVGKLRERGLYWRDGDPLASTEFTYSRFLTPYLARDYDLALFCDNDFLWLADIADLVRAVDRTRALHCVWHDYLPKETVKMNGKLQSVYPRKNWSSLMVFTIGDRRLDALSPECVNTSSGAHLHRFKWLDDSAIGALDGSWNWLEGSSPLPKRGMPNAVHFTRGGPWFENWAHVTFADLWLEERDRLYNASLVATP